MNRNKLSLLLAIVTILSTGLPASAELAPGDVNLIGIGVGFLTNLLNPPHRAAEINADVEMKRIRMAADVDIEREKLRIAAAADRVSPILTKWGVARANCAPGLVFINGIDANANTVCIQPNRTFTPGYYTYNHERAVLSRTSSTVTSPTQFDRLGGALSDRATTNLTAIGNTTDKSF
jgi:hypothetical protein